MRPDPDVVEALTNWLEDAKRGELRGVFMVGQYADGSSGEEYVTGDLPDLLCDVRGAVIRSQRSLTRAATN